MGNCRVYGWCSYNRNWGRLILDRRSILVNWGRLILDRRSILVNRGRLIVDRRSYLRSWGRCYFYWIRFQKIEILS